MAYSLFDVLRGANIPLASPITAGTLPGIVGFANTVATTDPGASNDITQGYIPGAIWVNSSAGALRWWECRSNAQGAASWIFGGADYVNGGSNPANEVTQFGSGTSLMFEEGNLSRQVFANQNAGTATGQDIVLAVYTLSGNSFDISGRTLTITAQGSFGSNGNTKRQKLIIGANGAVVGSPINGGTTIADSGALTTNGSGWALMATVSKYGIAGSNTQVGLHQQNQAGPTVGPLIATSLLTLTEASPFIIAITANCTTLGTDAVVNFFEVNAMN